MTAEQTALDQGEGRDGRKYVTEYYARYNPAGGGRLMDCANHNQATDSPIQIKTLPTLRVD